MISHVLSEAVREIREYLNEPAYANTYQGEVREEIEAVVAAMDAVRAKLDAPPGEDMRGRCVPRLTIDEM